MQGLMQDFPLTLPHFFRRAERLYPEKEVVTATATGIERTNYGDWAARTRKLGGALDDLGISEDGRVATFAWNTARHLELYFAAPCTGRVLHTLNIRLFPEQLVYIVNHAEDEVIFVDRSLMGLLWPLVDQFTTVKHFVLMDDGKGEVPSPDGGRPIHDYEDLIGSADPVEFDVQDENRAAAMAYTSGTTGNPKGVVY
jgi:fatty-acyl-CoA synthase